VQAESPPHSHGWDGSFYVTKGAVQFACNGQPTICLAGTLAHIPAGTIHAFSFGPDGGEMLEVTGAGSKAIEMFSALDREIPPDPLYVPKVVQVAGQYGLEFDI
jgi:quercetin dioxygenase-like cupin family protein